MTMRNRKTIIVAFVLLACMLLAVGFAAMADQLDISGTTEVSFTNAQNAFDKDVYFSAVSTGTGYTAEISASDPDTATYKFTGLSNVGDTLSITFTITNENAFDVSCVLDPANTVHTREEYFEFSTNVGDTAFTVPAGGSFDVVLTAELLQLPQLSEGQTLSGTYAIQYDVTDIVAGG